MDPLSAGSPLEKAKTYSLPPIVDTTVSHSITFEDKTINVIIRLLNHIQNRMSNFIVFDVTTIKMM